MTAALSAGFAADIGKAVLTMRHLWKIKLRAGVSLSGGVTVQGFTDWDSDLVYDDGAGDGPVTYYAYSGFAASAFKGTADMAVNNLELQGMLSSDHIREEDLRAGKYDFAELRIMLVNVRALAHGHMADGRYYLGETQIQVNQFLAEMRGLTQLFAQAQGKVTSASCRADVYDDKCKVVAVPAAWQASHAYAVGDQVSPTTPNGRRYKCTTAGTSGGSEPSWNTTTAGTTADGGVTWTAYQAFRRTGTVSSVIADDQLVLSLDGSAETNTDLATWEGDATTGWYTNGGTLAHRNTGSRDGSHYLYFSGGKTPQANRSYAFSGAGLALVQAGVAVMAVDWYQGGSGDGASGMLSFRYLRGGGAQTADTVVGEYQGYAAATWEHRSLSGPIPADATKVQILLDGSRISGSECDAYFDSIHLAIATDPLLSGGFDGGLLTFTGGDNEGMQVEATSVAADGTVLLFLPTWYPAAPGDTITLTRGCDKLFPTCWGVFDNAINFRGEPDIPGITKTLRAPNATG